MASGLGRETAEAARRSGCANQHDLLPPCLIGVCAAVALRVNES